MLHDLDLVTSVGEFRQVGHTGLGVLIHDNEEVAENVKVECGRDHSSSGCPFLAVTYQQALAQPLFQETVVERLDSVLATREKDLQKRKK